MAAAALAAGSWLLAAPPRLPGRRPIPWRRLWPGLLAAGASAAAVFGWREGGIPLAVAGLAMAGSAADHLRRWRRGQLLRAAASTRQRVVQACEAIAADLAAGLPPAVALAGAAAEWPALAPPARSAEFGGDVPAALRTIAQRPGAGEFGVLASAWQVAQRSGTALAPAVALAAELARGQQGLAARIDTEIAAARATALLVAALPMPVLALAAGVGGRPFAFLLQSPTGVGCLAAGLAMIHAGLAWLDAIAARAAGSRC